MALTRWIGTEHWDELADTPAARVLASWRAHAQPDGDERNALAAHVRRKHLRRLAEIDAQVRRRGGRMRMTAQGRFLVELPPDPDGWRRFAAVHMDEGS